MTQGGPNGSLACGSAKGTMEKKGNRNAYDNAVNFFLQCKGRKENTPTFSQMLGL